MFRKFATFFGLLMLSGALFAADDPVETVRETATTTLEAVEQQRDQLQTDTEKLYRLVEEVLLPAFDFDYTARLVLGRHARQASPEQMERFKAAFREFLIRTYANGLLQYEDNKIDIEPLRGPADPRYTVVRTKVYLNDGTAVPVDYALRKTGESWKVFDVTIEGISYVTNYRNDFAAQIEQKGLDALIERLETKAAEAEKAVQEGETPDTPEAGKGGGTEEDK